MSIWLKRKKKAYIILSQEMLKAFPRKCTGLNAFQEWVRGGKGVPVWLTGLDEGRGERIRLVSQSSTQSEFTAHQKKKKKQWWMDLINGSKEIGMRSKIWPTEVAFVEWYCDDGWEDQSHDRPGKRMRWLLPQNQWPPPRLHGLWSPETRRQRLSGIWLKV